MRKPHLATAHRYFEKYMQKDGVAIDATCGNGYDTYFIAKIAPNGTIFAMDRQKEALDKAKELLAPLHANIHWVWGCHSKICDMMPPNSVDLIVYNLGYLPGSDKTVITGANTTLLSLKSACTLLKEGGAIIVTTYSGHPGGAEEEAAVIDFARSLPKSEFEVEQHIWLNWEKGPTVLRLNKMLSR